GSIEQLPDYGGEARAPGGYGDAEGFLDPSAIENRVHRALCRRRVLVGGDRLHFWTRYKLRGCQFEDRLGKTAPADRRIADEMVGAPAGLASFDVSGDRGQRGGDVGGGGRASALVRDDAQNRAL